MIQIDQFLKELKAFGIANEVPNISEVNARFLRDLIKIKQVKNMLEIGTANGYSAIQFALELKNTWGKITTIEFSTLSHAQALQNFETAGVQDVIDSRLGNALDIIPTLEEKYDFVFIEGMKRRTKDFLELVWDKVLPGGIIIIDDVIKFREKMVGFWEHLEEQKIPYNIIPIDVDDGIVMIVK